ncbi:katanin p80 WD40 repeat-containing subunit B1-like [Ptychodera flava]|uniref:katanin p80 WD40 repeat-containing subunit B1-like n=1 Tax=Ptychodera flava TaxID=63121 RepID=UPI00396A9523
MAATKRAWKLQEFVAHGANVNCLALGSKSGRVMVTGGEDKKVNMWAVGKPNCIMSLSGHTSPVESVRFGNSEELVAAGSQSGTVKIWDLEAAKIVRTLTGHKSSIRSLDFHPYGEFVVSGSLDTNIKLWDVRRKGCIFTYRGHTNCVNYVRFSPDGRWVASAGEDGVAKLWDLTAGKIIHEFTLHQGPINNIEFHPNEFLLATGSSDRTVKFWDLETMQLVSSSDKEANPIRCIHFHPEGNFLFSGAQDSLRVYGWEPARCYDSYSMGWGKIGDIAVASNQLIGASYNLTNVSIYVVDLSRTNLSEDHSVQQPSLPTPPPLTASGHRKNFVTDRPRTQCGQANQEIKTEPNEDPAQDQGEDDTSSGAAQIQIGDDYREIFQPRRNLAHSPTTNLKAPFPAPLDEPSPAVVPVSMPPPSQPVSQPVLEPRQVSPPRQSVQVHQTPVVPSDRNKPVGLDMNAFLPKQPQPYHAAARPSAGVNDVPSQPEITENEVLGAIEKGHNSMCAVMNSRYKNLDVVRSIWSTGETKTAVESAINMNDLAVTVDLLNVMCLKMSLWSLDLCVKLLPKIEELIESKYENYIHTGCQAIKLVMKGFSGLIKANVNSPPISGVDISREERYRKCKTCYDSLLRIRNTVEQKQHMSGKLGSTFREIKLILGGLES